MKIEILEQKSFAAKAGARTVSGLFHAESWNGLDLYRDSNGETIIIDAENDGKFVKGSPGLVSRLDLSPVAAGFVTVPETRLPGGLVVPAFQVAQFAASKGDDGKAVVDGSLKPWTKINYKDAISAALLSGCALITETQWLAIAYNASQQAANWTEGAVGKGKMFQGHRSGDGTLTGEAEVGDPEVCRWLTLSNGSKVCDFNGNVFQWVFDDLHGDTEGIVNQRFELDSPSLSTAPYPSQKKGMGYRPDYAPDWSCGALIRGGCWDSDGDAGAFRLNSCWPDDGVDFVGFRLTKPSPGL